jgi:cytidylate kinase
VGRPVEHHDRGPDGVDELIDRAYRPAGLAKYPNAFRVRLDGPVEARARWAMTYGHLDEEAARRAQRETDRVHEAYVRHLYGTSMTDPSHFHLYVDVTVLDAEACAKLLEEWVHSRVPVGEVGPRH